MARAKTTNKATAKKPTAKKALAKKPPAMKPPAKKHARKPLAKTPPAKKPARATPVAALPSDEVKAEAAIIADGLALGRRDELGEQIAALLPIAVAEYRRQFPKAIFDPTSITCLFCSVTRAPDAIQAHVDECGMRFLAGLRKPVPPSNNCPWCGQWGLAGHHCRVKPA